MALPLCVEIGISNLAPNSQLPTSNDRLQVLSGPRPRGEPRHQYFGRGWLAHVETLDDVAARSSNGAPDARCFFRAFGRRRVKRGRGRARSIVRTIARDSGSRSMRRTNLLSIFKARKRQRPQLRTSDSSPMPKSSMASANPLSRSASGCRARQSAPARPTSLSPRSGAAAGRSPVPRRLSSYGLGELRRR